MLHPYPESSLGLVEPVTILAHKSEPCSHKNRGIDRESGDKFLPFSINRRTLWLRFSSRRPIKSHIIHQMATIEFLIWTISTHHPHHLIRCWWCSREREMWAAHKKSNSFRLLFRRSPMPSTIDIQFQRVSFLHNPWNGPLNPYTHAMQCWGQTLLPLHITGQATQLHNRSPGRGCNGSNDSTE